MKEVRPLGLPTEKLTEEQKVNLLNAYRLEYFIEQRNNGQVDQSDARFSLLIFENTALGVAAEKDEDK